MDEGVGMARAELVTLLLSAAIVAAVVVTVAITQGAQ